MKKYVVTGGPCSGKTTILNSINSLGFHILPESSRIVMEKYNIHPKKDFNNFQRILMIEQMGMEINLSNLDVDVAFLDRSILDNYAYANFGNVTCSPEIEDFVRNTDYSKIFLLDITPEYKKDDQRWESQYMAKTIHNKIHNTYNEFGYNPIEVPFFEEDSFEKSVEKRRDFILKRI